MKNPYLRLIRLHQPTGIWLLLWPCWWGIALAGHGPPPFGLLLLFAAGAVVMRGAGCIVNDLWDRELDKQVERTHLRPLASGELSVRQALLFLFLLLCVALVIALLLPRIDLYLAAFSLLLVVAYPAMKRFTWWPQAFLGLTFNWGALMGYAALRGTVEIPAVLLYAAGFFWTLAYDTIYAHQDKRDDVGAGIKSTALALGGFNKPALLFFYGMMLALLAAAGYARGLPAFYYSLLAVIALQVIWVVVSVRLDHPADCMRKFRANRLTGGLIWLALALGIFV